MSPRTQRFEDAAYDAAADLLDIRDFYTRVSNVSAPRSDPGLLTFVDRGAGADPDDAWITITERDCVRPER